MGKAIAAILLLVVVLPVSHAIVGAFTEAQGKPLPKKFFYPVWILTTLAIIGLLALTPKCSSEDPTSPNGQTLEEHYEPRY